MPHLRIGSVACILIAAACGGGDGGGGPNPSTATIGKGPTSGDNQSGTVGQPLSQPIQVIVRRDGVAEAGTQVTWATQAIAGTLNPVSSTTDAAGLASSSWTLGTTAGAQTATASVSGATGSPVSFMATAATAAASSLAIVSGNNQAGQTGDALASPLVVRVIDPFGNGVTGTPVTWAVTGGTATVNPTSSTTGLTGTASTQVTLGMTAGTIAIQATSGTLGGSPVTFTAQATAPAPNAVQVINNQFVPATITVPVNTTVTWTWGQNASQHNITPDNPSNVPSEPAISNAPHTYTHTFTTPGTYDYYCVVHGGPQTGMHGTVIVQ